MPRHSAGPKWGVITTSASAAWRALVSSWLRSIASSIVSSGPRRRRLTGSGAVYEVQIPWGLFKTNGAVNPGTPGFTFGFNFILTDDDGDRIGPQDLPAGVDPKTLPEGKREGDFRGALKTLQLTPSVLLHERKDRLWQGFIPEYFAKITLR